MDRRGMQLPRMAWVGLALLIGCASDPLEPEMDALSAARARWSTAGLRDYEFEFQRLCFCGPDFVRPLHLVVVDGSVSSATYLDTGEPAMGPLDSFPTIEDLFDEIRAALDQGADSVVASYDRDSGYPTRVEIDFIEQAIDDEMTFVVSALIPLAPG